MRNDLSVKDVLFNQHLAAEECGIGCAVWVWTS